VQALRLLLALAILAGVWAYALKPRVEDGAFPWRWGMDMNGGVQLVYQVQPDYLASRGLEAADVQEELEESRVRLRRRVVAFHTEETKVVALGEDRILVEVPGVRDIEQVKREIGRPQYLEFRGVLDFAPTEAPPPDEDGWYEDPDRPGWILLGEEPGLRGEEIVYDELPEEPSFRGDDRSWSFPLPLTPAGQDRFGAFTREFADAFAAMLVDDAVQAVLHIEAGGLREPVISCGSRREAVRLLKLLRSGPLPLPFDLVQQRTVSPVLAAQRQSNLTAITAGIAVLVLFFGLTYLHRPYFLVVAAAAVLLEAGLFVCVANLGWVRISLPQLAGLALLIGMSVDAFILVFEQVERSLPEGRWDPAQAVRRARDAFAAELGVIFWAGTTTVASLAGLLLVEGVMREYFVLLAIGVAISLTAALYLRLIMGVELLARLTAWATRERPIAPWVEPFRTLDLTRLMDPAARVYKVVAPLALGVVVVVWWAGWAPLGIDFRGGAEVRLEVAGPADAARVRAVADEVFDARTQVQILARSGHYAVRVPRVVPQSIGGSADVAAMASTPSGAPGAGEGPRYEEELVTRIEEDLGVEASLVAVEQLGQAAAFANVVSSLKNALWGLCCLTVLCAVLYVSLTVPFWVVLALFVDVTIVQALLLLLGVPIDYPLIAAFLTFAGYSINDSIVVCHEVRARGKPRMDEVVQGDDPELPGKIRAAIHAGIRPLGSRVLLTSITTMLTMVPLLFTDGVLRTFGIVFVLGTAVGTLSSVFIVGRNAHDVVMGDTVTV